jgi:hypothetical protein
MPGSSESGAVPITSVTVPDFADAVPLVVPEDVDDELDELPHALNAITDASVSATLSAVLLCLPMSPPPLRFSVRPEI